MFHFLKRTCEVWNREHLSASRTAVQRSVHHLYFNWFSLCSPVTEHSHKQVPLCLLMAWLSVPCATISYSPSLYLWRRQLHDSLPEIKAIPVITSSIFFHIGKKSDEPQGWELLKGHRMTPGLSQKKAQASTSPHERATHLCSMSASNS